MAGDVKVIGLDKLRKKLDPQNLLEPELERIIKEEGQATVSSLGPTLPKGPKNSAAQLRVTTTPIMAVVSLPRVPFIFLEAGSLYPKVGVTGASVSVNGVTTYKRSHRRLTAAKRRQGTYRIQPRRFLRTEYRKIRQRMKQRVEVTLKSRLEKAWSA